MIVSSSAVLVALFPRRGGDPFVGCCGGSGGYSSKAIRTVCSRTIDQHSFFNLVSWFPTGYFWLPLDLPTAKTGLRTISLSSQPRTLSLAIVAAHKLPHHLSSTQQQT
ncbi:hypothetical protein TYRP_006177, partial [Tyrophagus putrescentiae]